MAGFICPQAWLLGVRLFLPLRVVGGRGVLLFWAVWRCAEQTTFFHGLGLLRGSALAASTVLAMNEVGPSCADSCAAFMMIPRVPETTRFARRNRAPTFFDSTLMNTLKYH